MMTRIAAGDCQARGVSAQPQRTLHHAEQARGRAGGDPGEPQLDVRVGAFEAVPGVCAGVGVLPRVVPGLHLVLGRQAQGAGQWRV